MKLPLWRIAEFVSGTGDYDPEAVAQSYSIDSRTIQPGELFIAIKGERFDGHDFVSSALEAGAVAAMVGRSEAARFSDKTGLIFVGDTLAALQIVGGAVRKLWGKTLIAVTGSAGKTTTKECIAQVLAAKHHVFKSQGNLNNHFGLPLQLLKLETEHEIAVVEMGMNHAGEIAALCKIATPDWGVVTNVHPVHTENFADGIAGVARAKYELIAGLPAGGHAFLNADDAYVSQFGRDFKGKVTTFGIAKPADVSASDVTDRGAEGSEFTLVAGAVRQPVRLALMGRHSVYNAVAAAAVGMQARMSPSECAAALATIQPSEKRGQVMHLGGATIINDCYNSNPAALKAMTDALLGVSAKRHIVVAGEMLELGPEAAKMHRECGEYMAERGVKFVLGVRGNAIEIAAGAQAKGAASEFVDSPEFAAAHIAKMLQPGDAILFKASRGVRLERALEVLQNALSSAGTAVPSSSSGHD